MSAEEARAEVEAEYCRRIDIPVRADEYFPQEGDRVKFNADALRQKDFHGARADGRKRMTVVAVGPYRDVVLDTGEVWNAAWLEPVPAVRS